MPAGQTSSVGRFVGEAYVQCLDCRTLESVGYEVTGRGLIRAESPSTHRFVDDGVVQRPVHVGCGSASLMTAIGYVGRLRILANPLLRSEQRQVRIASF